jgi:hypothetical protein
VGEEASSEVWRLGRLAFMQSGPPRSVGIMADRQARADPQSIAEDATRPTAACEQRAGTQSQIHCRKQAQGPRPFAPANPSRPSRWRPHMEEGSEPANEHGERLPEVDAWFDV